MITAWMLRLVLAAALVAVAARVAEEAARAVGWPRRWVWAGAFLVVASMPWLGAVLPVPSVVEAILAGLAPGTTATVEAPADASGPMVVRGDMGPATWTALGDRVLAGGWAIASLALAFVFGLALLRLRFALRRCAARVRVDGIDVIRATSLGPATIGIVRPAILLPRWVDELPAAERALIMSHEREHATARDPLLLAAAALILTAAPWCLPLWWMHRRLRDAAEADCDARVVARGADRLAYGRALLHAAGRPRSRAIAFAAPLLGGAAVTRLERRIMRMTEHRPKHPLRRAVPLMALAAAAVVVACEAADHTVGASERASAVGANDLADEGFFLEPIRSSTTAREGGAHELETAEVDEESQGTDVAVEQPEPDKIRIDADTVVIVPSGSDGWLPDVVPSAAALAEAAKEATGAAVRLHERRAAGGPSGPEPVFYIDGERVADHHAALERLDPAMIESIEVLKGRAAAREYGPQHTAGVVLIYTKKR